MSWLVEEFYKKGLVMIGEFKLSSGLPSPFYIDARKLYSYPELVRRVVEEIVSRVSLDDVDVIAGVESAGIPLAAYITCLTRKPLAYVRKQRKAHGTGSAVEGDVKGKRVAIVDDVATTGSSLVRAVHYLREAGAIPKKALVIIDREQGAEKALRDLGVELYAVLKAREVFEVLFGNGLISREDYIKVITYLNSFRVS